MEDQLTQYAVQIGGTAGVIMSAFFAWLKTARSSPERVGRDLDKIMTILERHTEQLAELKIGQAVATSERSAIRDRVSAVERRMVPQGGADDEGEKQ